MNIPFINLKTQYLNHKIKLDDAILSVLSHGKYIMGPEVKSLEEKLAEYVKVKHVLSCSSGTDALVLSLMTKKLASTDAIFTTPFTFFASAESITLAGGTPIFVDIDPHTYNINPAEIEKQIQRIISEGKLNPRGILAVNLFGIAADYRKIQKIADKYDLFILEDAAQSFAADYHGQKACSLGDMAATSFYPAKPLGCYGDGGAVFTNDSDLYKELISLRVHGQATSENKYDNVRIGLNARMDTIQAAVLLEKLKFYDDEIDKRNHVAALYSERLQDVVKTPHVPDGQQSVWAQYSVQSDKREDIIKHLNENGIPTAVFYPIPIHLSTAYQHLGYQNGDFPISEAISKQIFSLPMHPYLEESDIITICDLIAGVVDT